MATGSKTWRKLDAPAETGGTARYGVIALALAFTFSLSVLGCARGAPMPNAGATGTSADSSRTDSSRANTHELPACLVSGPPAYAEGSPVRTGGVPADPADPVVQESRRLILRYGFSEAYFARHFRPGIRYRDQTRTGFVEWEFTLGPYRTRLRDSLGFAGGATVHSVAPPTQGFAPPFRDIETVMAPADAYALALTCVPTIQECNVMLNLNGPQPGLLFRFQERMDCPGPESRRPCVAIGGTIDLMKGQLSDCYRPGRARVR